MAEALIRTLRHNYVLILLISAAQVMMRRLPGCLAHHNEVQPQRALGHYSTQEDLPGH